jgi:hypothetical protein
MSARRNTSEGEEVYGVSYDHKDSTNKAVKSDKEVPRGKKGTAGRASTAGIKTGPKTTKSVASAVKSTKLVKSVAVAQNKRSDRVEVLKSVKPVAKAAVIPRAAMAGWADWHL